MKAIIFQYLVCATLWLDLATAQEVTKSSLKPLGGEALTIPGATVSSESQASEIAFKTFLATVKGLSATESYPVDYIIRLGFDVPDFGRKGDKVWQVRVWDMASGTTGIIWIHSDTGHARILISR